MKYLLLISVSLLTLNCSSIELENPFRKKEEKSEASRVLDSVSKNDRKLEIKYSEWSTVKASYYNSGLKTANGEKFDKNGWTAAHRDLPFGQMIEVTNLKIGKSVIVRINDRGPAKFTGNDLDLSEGAAKEIGMFKTSLVRYRKILE